MDDELAGNPRRDEKQDSLGRDMSVRLDGHVRARTRTRFGPFEREKWEITPFKWEGSLTKSCDEYERVTGELGLRLELAKDRVVVRGRLRKQNLILGDSKIDEPRSFPISVLSVSGIELNGQLSFVPGPTRKSGSG